jgi:hypothetical protein
LQFKANLGKYFTRPYRKKKSQKRAGGVVQDVEPEFKPQYHQKKKKKNLNEHTTLTQIYILYTQFQNGLMLAQEHWLQWCLK